MKVYGVISSFTYDKTKLCFWLNATENRPCGYFHNENYGYNIHIRKIGERNLVLYVQVTNKNDDTSWYSSKYKAKLIKNKWQLKIKNGVQYLFDEYYMSESIDKAMAEIILLE